MTYQELDPHLLAPKRFVTLAHLNQVEQADYPALQESTGLSTPDLSKIIRDLEERGLVEVTKERKNRYGHTLVRLSDEGEKRFRELLRTLNEVAGH
ncbi:transcriptional regulator [Georgenia sunbinii]|uniref:transcriptional regulator n=1 Tax=Georgenia sunbinii TaxID=3117728 RepID=UPI002F2606EE